MAGQAPVHSGLGMHHIHVPACLAAVASVDQVASAGAVCLQCICHHHILPQYAPMSCTPAVT
jgi:hypothetical protein